jgi:DNA-binding NarL/FixJ family response regulator
MEFSSARHRRACHQGLALGLRGEVEEAERMLLEAESTASADFAGRGVALWCRAEAYLWAGEPARALAMADASLEFATSDGTDVVLPSLARAWAEVELGRAPTRITAAPPVRALAGAVPEYRALAARARGNHESAAFEFDRAANLWAGHDVTRQLLCRWAAGDALRRCADRATAIAWLRLAVAGAEARGLEPLAARARRSLRLVGERVAKPRAAGPGPGRLTSREREVLGLVERGLTNVEIARRISLGRPTVARLVSNAMVKLGAETRTQAVVLAAQLSVAPAVTAPLRWDVQPEHRRGYMEDDARAILRRLASGQTLGQAAAELGLSRRTADRRLARARRALGADRTVVAVARARRTGLIGVAGS